MASTRNGYSTLQIGLHWAIFVLIVVQLISGDGMTEMIEAGEDGKVAAARVLFQGTLHYWAGIAVLVLAVARIAVRFTTGVPAHAGTANPALDMIASIVHWAFYVLLFAVPISGLMAYYFGDPMGEIHELGKPAFIVLILVHAGGALFNQFVRKDGTLMRMLRPAR